MNKYINILKLYSNYNFKKHLKPIFLLFAMSLSVSIYINLDKTMLGLIIGDDAVGLYSAASKITKIILVFATSLGTILLPRMSYLINKKNDYEIKKLITKSLDFTLLISLPIVTGLFLLGEPIILVFVGSDYISSVTTLKILSLVILPIGLTNLIGIQILVSHGLEKFTILSTVIAAIINLTLNYILIPIYSHNGAAIASLIAEVSVVIIQLYFTQKFLIGTLRIKNLISYFFGIVLIILIVLATKIFISNYLLLLFISASGGFVVYFLYLYVIKNDLIYYTTNSLIKKILKKI
jgi:O-antigen/teichoic acid export membrane protein